MVAVVIERKPLMDSRTLTALMGSIEKWEKIVAGTGVDNAMENCPLCREFLSLGSCTGCPVDSKTNRPLCKGTPYVAFADFMERLPVYRTPINHLPSQDDRTEATRLAQAELDFLKSLLPEEDESQA